MRPVRLCWNKNLSTFCQFVLTGDLKRMSYLRNLTIEHIKKPCEDREKFAQVLAHCTNLKKLTLQWCDGLIMDEPVVPDAISALPNLAHFSAIMYKDSKESQAVLLRIVASMKSPLRALHLPMVEDGLSKVEVLQDLARVHGSLEDFTLQFSTFTAPGVIFPAVRDLHLTFEQNVPQLRDLRRTFPSVRELSIDYHMHLGETPPDGTVGTGTYDDESCWPSLERLRASVLIIRALGIVCPVRRLDLGYYDSDLHDKTAETVSRLRPSKLTLNLYCAPDWATPRAHPSLLLHGSGDTGVKHLYVKTTFSRTHAPATQDFIVSIRGRSQITIRDSNPISCTWVELHTPATVRRTRRAPARRDIRALHVRRPGRDRRPALEGIRRRRTSHRRRGSRRGLGTGLRVNPHRGGHDRAGGTYGLEGH